MLEKEVRENKTGLEIAVIGMAARFPGASNINEFWDNLINGTETLTFYSDKELKEAGIKDEMIKDPAYVKSYGWLGDIEFFDYSFFGYTPLEAEIMDPQLCILHECAIQALEHAGYDCYTCKELIGLYAGASHNFDWQVRAELSGKTLILGRFASLQLNDKDFLATRIAHRLSLKGPAVTLDTACSTSLVAIHLACQGLLSGDCDMALAGGVSIPVLGKRGYLYQEGMLNSPDGHCRAFDETAKGCNFGNGVGLVVLKRLEEAEADGDTIHAVIKGSSINNDGGRKPGYTAPSIEGQAEVIRNAHEMAEVHPETIGYVETHGTGTPLGDPVEIEGLKTAFNTDEKHFCRLGSVKTNVGHLEIAAGIAGFIKTVLVLKNKLIPPSLNFKTPNPKIDFENSPFVVNKEFTPWERGENPRRAGVSSFGIGGTNAHVVLEETPGISGSVGQWVSESVREAAEGTGALAPLPGEEAPVIGHSSSVIGETRRIRDYQLILLSAKAQSALDKMTENLAGYFKDNLLNRGNHENPTNPDPVLADAAYTLQVGRAIHQHRRMLVCKDVPEAVRLLSSPGSGKMKTLYSREDNRPLVFIFPGLGSQYVNMGRGLYDNEPVFRREMDRCFEILNRLLEYEIKEILYPQSGTSNDRSDIHQPEIAQIVIFIFEYSLAQLLMSWGIRPHAMIGYSFGEYSAACAAGVFSLEDALKLVTSRGRLIQQAPEGAMLSVPLSREALAPYLNREVFLAIDNGPSCIAAGPTAAVEVFEKQMKDNRLMCMRVPVKRALHTPAMTPVLQEFAAILDTMQLNQPQIPYISNVSGDWAVGQEVVLPGYWTTHLSSPVRFAEGMKVLLKEHNSIFIEIGPGREISALIQRHIEDSENQDSQVLNLVKPSHQETADVYLLLNRVGMLWLLGQSIDWQGFYEEEKRQRIPLPTYPFEGQRCWIDRETIKININESGRTLPGGVSIQEPPDFVHWFYMPSWTRQTLLRPVHPGVSQKLKTNYLVFPDDCGIGMRLVERLKQEGHHVIIVEAGTEFLEKRAGIYVICPQQPQHYTRLLAELRTREVLPRQIVHLWGVTPGGEAPPTDYCTGNTQVPGEKSCNENKVLQYSNAGGPRAQQPDWSENVQDKGFYSLVHLAKAISQLTVTPTMNEPLQIAVVTNQMQEVTGEELLCPAKATVIGPLKVIPQELPGVRCRSIDVVLPGPGGPPEEQIIRQLLEEISTSSLETEIAYRGNFRWVRTYKPVPMENNGEKTTKLHEKGVYLVTGGLGKIGFLLARHLAKTVKAKLILTGRSPFPARETWDQWLAQHGNGNPISEKIKQMKELEENGAQFRVFSVDAADKENMQSVIAHTLQEWGTIDGVIHGAGIMKPGLFQGIQELTASTCQEHFQAKVKGTLILRELLQDQALDFVLLLSSISTVLGGIHFTAYAAANCFMDALARKYNRYNSGRWISVDWDGMDEEKTWQAFRWILSLDNLDQVVASKGGNLQERIDQWVKLESLGENDQPEKGKSKQRQARPDLLSAYVPPGTEREQVLVEAWQRLFGLEPVGIEDDFIELGGDSLKAITMINQVHKELNVTVPLVEFFKNPTIKWLARYTGSARIDVFQSIIPVEKKEYYPLSSAQKRLYILHKMNPAELGYNLAATMALEGECDLARLEYSFRRLIQRHESLRASFHLIHGEPVQEVHDEVEFEIEYLESAAQSPQPASALISSFIRPFDLSRAPLMRVALIKTAADKHILIVDMHHIVHDGISQTILFKEFPAFYRGEELPGLKIQYKDYAGWQDRDIIKQAVKKQELYWLKQFPGEIPVLNLPYDFPRPVIQGFDGSTAAFAIDKKETAALKKLTRTGNVTLFMVLLSIYYVFLSKLSGQEDIVIGTPEAGRKHPDLQPIIGFFLHTLTLRNYPTPDKTFHHLLEQVRERTLQAFENQDYPFEELVEQVAVNRDLSRSPLFDVMFILHTQWTSSPGNIHRESTRNMTIKSYHYEKSTSEFDLTLIGFDQGERLLLKFEYCTKLFTEGTIQRFIDYFKTLVTNVLKNPGQQIHEIEMIPQAERHRLLYDFNDTALEYPGNQTIHQLFANQAGKTPDHIALVGVHETHEAHEKNHNMSHMSHMSYRELNEQSRQLAGKLKEKGVKPGTIAAIMVKRTIRMMVGLLGILKAGAAYLPLDPEYPQKRIDYILANSSAEILLTSPGLSKEIKYKNAIVHVTDAPNRVPTPPHPDLSPAPVTCLAYVIYTSGSTGNPKGVAITHRNAVNFISAMTKRIRFSTGKTIAALTTISFDIFFLETFFPLTCGLKVVIVDEHRQQDPGMLRDFIAGNHVEMLQVTPSRLKLLLSTANQGRFLEGVETLIVGGEALPGHLLEQVKEVYTGKIYNVYGPTETTIWSTVKDLSPGVPGQLTIGTPIANTQVYIVDRQQRLQPLGIAGELLIGGDGVAAGYLNNADLTAEKFDHDLWDLWDYHDEKAPFGQIINAFGAGEAHELHELPRINQKLLRGVQGGGFLEKSPPGRRRQKKYRTGDLARWLPGGEIQFLGRLDYQVKIRGFRIELEEIEEQLVNHEQIKEAVVISRKNKNGDNYLSAYLVPARQQENTTETLSVSALREYLSGELPDYMIPSYFIHLEQMPVTPNGKINREALPEPVDQRPQLEVVYLEPESEMEKIIARTWQEELELEKIGVNDNFFDLGGNSMIVVRLINRLNQEFNKNIPVVSMFKHRTIRTFSEYLTREQDISLAIEDRGEALKRGEQARRKRYEMRKGSTP
jgi:iturin family lipopeptide synthetase A